MLAPRHVDGEGHTAGNREKALSGRGMSVLSLTHPSSDGARAGFPRQSGLLVRERGQVSPQEKLKQGHCASEAGMV